MRMLIGAVFVTEIVGAGMPHGRPGGWTTMSNCCAAPS